MSRKTRHKKVWQSVISCVLAFALAFSMTVPAFATSSINAEGGETDSVNLDVNGDGKINYVSFGASNVNGFGLYGYLPADVYENPDLKNNFNIYGYKIQPEGSYPDLLVDYFAEKSGYEVEIDQLAMSSMRAEEVRMMFDDAYNGDAYTEWRFTGGEKWFYGAGKLAYAELNNIDVTGHSDPKLNGVTFDQALASLRKVYQQDVANADVITWDVGINNFGVYLSGRVVDGDYNDPIENVSPEAAAYYARVKSYLFETIEAEYGEEMLANLKSMNAEHILDSLAYCLVAYCVNYDIAMEKIYELNPDVTVVNVSIQNLMKGLVAEIPGIEGQIPLGDLVAMVINAANTYMAVGSPYAERGYYANVSEDQHVTFFIDQLADYNGDPTTLDRDMIDCWRVYHYGGNMLAAFEPFVFDANGSLVDEGLTVNFGYGDVPLYGMQLVAIDTIAKYLQAAANLNVIHFDVLAGGDWGIVSDTGMNAIVNSVTEQVMAYYAHSLQPGNTYDNFPRLEVSDDCWTVLAEANGIDTGLMDTFAAYGVRTFIGNAFYAHPNRVGLQETRDIIVEAIEKEITGAEVFDGNLTEAMKQFYLFLSEDESMDATEKVDLLEKLYAVLEGNSDLDETPEVETVVKIYSFLSEGGYADDEQILAIVLAVYGALLYDAEGNVDKELTPDELVEVAKAVYSILLQPEKRSEGLDAVVLTDAQRIEIIAGIYSILKDSPFIQEGTDTDEMLATAGALYDALAAKGYLNDDQAFDIVDKLWVFLMLNDDRSEEAIAAAIDDVYLTVFFGEDPELTPAQRNEIGLIILGVLEEQGYIGEDKAIDLLDPYYQEAVADVLTAEVVDLIVKGIDAASAAVKAAQIAAEAYADSDLKDALLAELAATLETLDVARGIFAAGDLNDLRGAMAAMLELKGELEKHAATISVLAEEAGIAAEPYIVEALEAADAYIALADETVADIYAAAVEACEDFAAAYAAWVEEMAARAAAIDPALGDAVRAFLTDVPADSLAILYAYGDEALTKLVADAAVAYGDVYEIVAALAQVLYADGEAIYNAVLDSEDFAAVKAEIEALLADIEAMIEAAKMAPATTIVGYEEKLAELYDRLFDAYEKLYPIVLDAMDQVDPTLRPMVEELVDALYEALNVSSAFVGAYGEWLPGHANAMAGALLSAFLENWGEFAPVAGPIAEELAVELGRYLLAEMVRALPGIDAALYDWFYNNPDKVCGFFAEYGDEMGAFLADNYEAILGILGYIAYEYGDDALEYVLANPEQTLEMLVSWYNKYGYRVWPMVDVYLEYLGVYDALEAELAVLKAELEKAGQDMNAALKAEIEKQIAEIERQLAEIEKALAEMAADVEAALAKIEAAIAEIKALIAELEAMAEQLSAEVKAAIAALEAAVEAVEALIEGVGDIEAFFQQVFDLVGELYAELEAAGEAALADAVHGEYAISPDASYVALGDATIAAEGSYADQVAAFMANLAGSAGVQSDYQKIAVADDEDLAATVADVLAAVESGEYDEALANAGLVTVSAGAEDLTVSVVYKLVEILTAYAMPSADEAAALDWAAYVGADGAKAVEAALAQVEAALAEQIGDEAAAALAVDLVEAMAFAYVDFAVKYVELLDAVQVAAPNAHIVAVGLANALEGLAFDIDGFELALGEYAGWVIEAADLEMLAYALLDEGGNVTFVSAPNAACDAAAVIAEVVEAAMAIDFGGNPQAVLELLPLVAQIVETATWMPNEAGQAYIAEQILGAVDFAAVADAVYTAEAAQPAVAVAVDGVVVTEGFAVSSEAVEVTDEAVAVVAFEGGKSVEATFAIEHLATVESFEDFGEPADGHWYLEEGQGSFAELRTLFMDYALATGLMSGYVNREDGTITHFGPWDSLDRAQAATVIYRMANEDASATLDPAKYADNATAMADVEDGEYYTAAVNWCVENEIITGYLDGPNKGKFKPYNKVTRSELAAMVQRYCVNVCGVEMRSADVMGYEDSDLIDTAWALPGLEFCKAYGIMTGIHGKNELNPVGKANRAEAAKMFSVVGHDVL